MYAHIPTYMYTHIFMHTQKCPNLTTLDYEQIMCLSLKFFMSNRNKHIA